MQRAWQLVFQRSSPAVVSLLPDDGVEVCEQDAGDSDDGDLERLSGSFAAFAQGFQGRVELGCNEGGLAETLSHLLSPAPDMALAAHLP